MLVSFSIVQLRSTNTQNNHSTAMKFTKAVNWQHNEISVNTGFVSFTKQWLYRKAVFKLHLGLKNTID